MTGQHMAGQQAQGQNPATSPADLPADAMRALFGQVLAAVHPGQRDHVEAWLADLLDLAAGNLSDDARAVVIRQALAAGSSPAGAERDWEVSQGTKVVTARSAEQAARIARDEWNEETTSRYHEPDPNERYEVRPAYSRGQWRLVYPDQPPQAGRPVAPGAPDAPGAGAARAARRRQGMTPEGLAAEIACMDPDAEPTDPDDWRDTLRSLIGVARTLLPSCTCDPGGSAGCPLHDPQDTVWPVPGGEVRVLARSEAAGDRSDIYVLDVLGLTVLVRVRDRDTFVHIDGDGHAEIQRRPVVVEVFNGGENPYGEEWDYCDECGDPITDADGYDGLCGPCAGQAEAEGRWT